MSCLAEELHDEIRMAQVLTVFKHLKLPSVLRIYSSTSEFQGLIQRSYCLGRNKKKKKVFLLHQQQRICCRGFSGILPVGAFAAAVLFLRLHT